MADVFISYSKSRRQETIDLADDLEKRGFTVWWDKDITPGETFRDVINAELARARAAVVIWTPASVKSDWVISEVTRAHRRRVLIAVHAADLKSRRYSRALRRRAHGAGRQPSRDFRCAGKDGHHALRSRHA